MASVIIASNTGRLRAPTNRRRAENLTNSDFETTAPVVWAVAGLVLTGIQGRFCKKRVVLRAPLDHKSDHVSKGLFRCC